MYKLNDFLCKKCNHVTELLLDDKKPEVPSCEKCNSLEVEKVLTMGTGDKTHVSWSKWRASL